MKLRKHMTHNELVNEVTPLPGWPIPAQSLGYQEAN